MSLIVDDILSGGPLDGLPDEGEVIDVKTGPPALQVRTQQQRVLREAVDAKLERRRGRPRTSPTALTIALRSGRVIELFSDDLVEGSADDHAVWIHTLAGSLGFESESPLPTPPYRYELVQPGKGSVGLISHPRPLAVGHRIQHRGVTWVVIGHDRDLTPPGVVVRPR